MRKLVAVFFLVALSAGMLWSIDLEWGLKYGLGSSNLSGSEKGYELGYDISSVGAVNAPFGYLTLTSATTEAGTAQNAGVFCSFQVARKTDALRLQAELNWERFRYKYLFEESALSTDNLLLATEFPDTLKGSIRGTVDYLSLPLLIRLQQGLSEEQKDGQFQGAYIYLGPSIGFVISNQSASQGGIKALESDLDEFVLASQTDSDLSQSYASVKRESGTDKMLSYKTDLVMGLGFGLKDIFQLGIGKDGFVFDLRYTLGLHDLGKAPVNKAFRMRSIVVSIGVLL